MRKLLLLSLLINVLLILGAMYAVHRLGGFQYIKYRLDNPGVAGTYTNRVQLFELLPTDSTTIVFVGNSITEQCEWSELFGRTDIKNRGIAGDMTVGLLKRLPNIVALQPKKLFLMIGVNDLLFHAPSKALTNYQKIVEQLQLQLPNTQIYLQSVLPVNPLVRNISISNQDIITLNEGITQIARQHQLPFIDLHPLMCDENGFLKSEFTADGIHLNGKAYLVWKAAIDIYVNK